MRILSSSGISYEMREYDVSDGILDAKTAAMRMGVEPQRLFKTLVTKAGDGELCVFVIPGDMELDLKKAARAAGKKSVEMLPQKMLFSLTGYIHGGCSPVGMKKLYKTVFDEAALLFDKIVVSGGHIGLQVEVASKELIRITNAAVEEITRSLLR